MIDKTHKGLPINFNEIDEVWTCRSIGASNASLANLKKAIDVWDRKIRKSSAVKCYSLSVDLPKNVKNHGQGSHGVTFSPIEIVEYKGVSRYAKKVEVAAMPQGGSRRAFNLDQLVKDTPANAVILNRANDVAGEIWPLINRFWMILEELEYLTEEDVAQLKEIAERDPKDGGS